MQEIRSEMGAAAGWSTRGSVLGLGAGALLLISVVCIDLFVIGRPFTLKSPPDWSQPHLIRTFLLAGAAAMFVAALAGRPTARPEPESPAWPLGLAALLLVSFVGLFTYDPRLFSSVGSEENIVEWAQVGLIFAASGLFLGRTLRLRSMKAGRARIWLSAAFTLGFFAVGMEEISWGQWIVGLESAPALFAGNAQDEMNLHNYFTNETELLYYFGSFVWLILAVFVHEKTRWLDKARPLAELVPSRAILYLAVPLAFLNYAEWNQLTVQLAALLCLGILVDFALRRGGKPGPMAGAKGPDVTRMLLPGFALLLVTVQLVLLTQGHLLTKMWQTTEYKEFFAVLAFFFYSVEVYLRTAKGPSSSATAR